MNCFVREKKKMKKMINTKKNIIVSAAIETFVLALFVWRPA